MKKSITAALRKWCVLFMGPLVCLDSEPKRRQSDNVFQKMIALSLFT